MNNLLFNAILNVVIRIVLSNNPIIIEYNSEVGGIKFQRSQIQPQIVLGAVHTCCSYVGNATLTGFLFAADCKAAVF